MGRRKCGPTVHPRPAHPLPLRLPPRPCLQPPHPAHTPHPSPNFLIGCEWLPHIGTYFVWLGQVNPSPHPLHPVLLLQPSSQPPAAAPAAPPPDPPPAPPASTMLLYLATPSLLN